MKLMGVEQLTRVPHRCGGNLSWGCRRSGVLELAGFQGREASSGLGSRQG